MAHFKLLTIAALCAAPSAHAFYATPAAPAGWGAPSPSATSAILRTTSGAEYLNGVSKVNATLNAGGRAVSIPATLRYAAGAARVLGAVAYAHPVLFVGAAAVTAGVAYAYYNSHGLYVANGRWVKYDDDGRFEYLGWFDGKWYSSLGSACAGGLGAACYPGGAYWLSSPVLPNGCKAVLTSCDGGGSLGQQQTGEVSIREIVGKSARLVSEEEFSNIVAPHPLLDNVPQSFPIPVDLPVQPPVINPGPDGVARPYFVPTGNPVPKVGSTLCTQPGLTVKGTGNSLAQWEMDVLPADLPDQPCIPRSADEINAPLSPASSPASAPIPSAALPSDKPPGLCDQYPNIAACAPVKDFCKDNPKALSCINADDIPDIPDLDEKSKDISITPDSGWGESGGSCPAPRKLSNSEISFQPACDFANGVRPVVIAVAWLTAAGMLLGFGKGTE